MCIVGLDGATWTCCSECMSFLRNQIPLSLSLGASLLLAGCDVTAADADGDQGGTHETGGQTSDPGDPDDGFCMASSWPSPAAARRDATCEEISAGTFRCSCGQAMQAQEVGADRCRDALRSACGIDAAAPDFCEAPTFGSCWPGEDATYFDCQCDGQDDLLKAEGDSCSDALHSTCVELCSDETGACVRPTGASMGYGCVCGSLQAGDLTPASFENYLVSSGRSCTEALATTCGGSCELESGSCAWAGADYACSCGDGSEGSVAFDQSSPQACEASLEQVCGLSAHVPAGDCESEYGNVAGRCSVRGPFLRPGEALPDSLTFDCSCQADGAPNAATETAHSCREALQSFCPESIRPAQGDSPLALDDYATLCSEDGDCTGGACYIPGTELDPICSKQCDGDSDCPDRTLCVLGYCMIECEQGDDESCLRLNDAVSNPLYCMPVTDVDGAVVGSAHVCIQGSEEP